MSELCCREISFDSPEYHQAVHLRQEVLRKPLGLRREGFDEEETAIHLGGFLGENLVAILLLCPRGEGMIQMRQVAVAEPFRGKGYGAKLVRFAEGLARKRGFLSMIANARCEALGFYERLGYEAIGGEFLDLTIPHRRVEKWLSHG